MLRVTLVDAESTDGLLTRARILVNVKQRINVNRVRTSVDAMLTRARKLLEERDGDRCLGMDAMLKRARKVSEKHDSDRCRGMVETRAAPCSLEGCCARLFRDKSGRCASRKQDIFDCFVDAELDGVFKLKNLYAMPG